MIFKLERAMSKLQVNGTRNDLPITITVIIKVASTNLAVI
jgi:hypothetical protein